MSGGKTSAEACEEALKILESGELASAESGIEVVVKCEAIALAVRCELAALKADMESERKWTKEYFDQLNAAKARIVELEAQTHRWRYYGDEHPPDGQVVLVKVRNLGNRSEDDRDTVETSMYDGTKWDGLDPWYEKVIAWCPMPNDGGEQ